MRGRKEFRKNLTIRKFFDSQIDSFYREPAQAASLQELSLIGSLEKIRKVEVILDLLFVLKKATSGSVLVFTSKQLFAIQSTKLKRKTQVPDMRILNLSLLELATNQFFSIRQNSCPCLEGHFACSSRTRLGLFQYFQIRPHFYFLIGRVSSDLIFMFYHIWHLDYWTLESKVRMWSLSSPPILLIT